MTKSCPKGQYYCYTDKKCKKIPKGYAIGARGYLRQEPQDDDSKKNGNGKSNGHSKSNGGHGNGGGNGNGGNGSGGNGGGVSEATMTPSQKRKDTMLKKKYDDSGMMKSMKKQYGKEEGKKVYYATIRKQAMETKYYDGSDRNPNTGLPKGIKGGETKTKDPKLKGVPYNLMRAHYEIPVTDIQVSDLDELTDYKSFAAKAQEIRDKRRQRKEDQKQKDKEYMAKKKERAEKGIRFYDTKGKGYMKGGIKTYEGVNEEGLRDWFGKSKSKDGKPGWVNVKTGGTCASDEPGEGTPKCVSSAKRASMSKAERESASRRKKAADPGQQSKTGAAKPTYVPTDKPKKKKMTEEKKNKNVKGIAKELDKAVAMHKSQAKRLRKAGVSEENVVEAKDKKGKGSGSKDACYHKVKSRYSVWPSAYASGALVKCRKVGAANWGNKSEAYEVTNADKKGNTPAYQGYKAGKKNKLTGKPLYKAAPHMKENAIDIQNSDGQTIAGVVDIVGPANMKPITNDDGVWKGTEQISEDVNAEGMAYGLYKGDGKPKGQMAAFGKKKKENPYSIKNKLKMVIKSIAEKERGKAGVTSEAKETPKNVKKIAKELDKAVEMHKSQASRLRKAGISEENLDEKCWKGYEKKGMKTMFGKRYPNCVKKKIGESVSDWRSEIGYEGKDEVKKLSEDDMKGMSVKSGHKRPTKSGAGMTQKGVEAYRRRNPGSKLKTAVTTEPSKLKKGSKASNRRKSYCARSAGQMKKFPKAAKDPNSRLRQARRRWNC